VAPTLVVLVVPPVVRVVLEVPNQVVRVVLEVPNQVVQEVQGGLPVVPVAVQVAVGVCFHHRFRRSLKFLHRNAWDNVTTILEVV
jgi:hypothetical protein